MLNIKSIIFIVFSMLKTIHERRINKGNWGGRPGSRVSMPEGYAGFFHTNYNMFLTKI